MPDLIEHLPLPQEAFADIAERTRQAMGVLSQSIERDPRKLSGVPVLAGTRFSVPQLFAELSDSDSIDEIADEFQLDAEQIRVFLQALSVFLNRSYLS